MILPFSELRIVDAEVLFMLEGVAICDLVVPDLVVMYGIW
jgi:hypothetical protein